MSAKFEQHLEEFFKLAEGMLELTISSLWSERHDPEARQIVADAIQHLKWLRNQPPPIRKDW